MNQPLRLLEEHDSARAAQLAEFDGELSRRFASLNRGDRVDPAQARARLQRKSAERRLVEMVAVTQGSRDTPHY